MDFERYNELLKACKENGTQGGVLLVNILKEFEDDIPVVFDLSYTSANRVDGKNTAYNSSEIITSPGYKTNITHVVELLKSGKTPKIQVVISAKELYRKDEYSSYHEIAPFEFDNAVFETKNIQSGKFYATLTAHIHDLSVNPRHVMGSGKNLNAVIRFDVTNISSPSFNIYYPD